MGNNTAPDKILVTYASRAGSTVGVAEAIGKTLSEKGLNVDVCPMTEVHDLTPYRAVVAGSAIRIDRWLPEAMDFLKRHQAALAQIPVATFLVCLAMSAKDPQTREKSKRSALGWLQPVRELVTPVSEGLFAGGLNISKIKEFWFRFPFRLIVLLGFWKEGDYRDWDAIRGWANSLPVKLMK